MTVLSTALGVAAPLLLPRQLTHWAGALLFCGFGVQMLHKSARSPPAGEGGSEELEEVEGELKQSSAEKRYGQYSRYLSPVLAQAFVMTFLAEWGDRSQVCSGTLLSLRHQRRLTPLCRSPPSPWARITTRWASAWAAARGTPRQLRWQWSAGATWPAASASERWASPAAPRSFSSASSRAWRVRAAAGFIGCGHVSRSPSPDRPDEGHHRPGAALLARQPPCAGGRTGGVVGETDCAFRL